MDRGGPRQSREETNRATAAGLLLLLAVVHTVLALGVFRPFDAFLSAAGFDAFDYCVLDYQCFVARQTHAAAGRLWGYDPFFLAGHVQTFVWNSNVFLQWLTIFFSSLPVGMVLKLAVVGSAFVVPWLCYIAWRGFGFSRRASLVGALAGVLWFRASMAFAYWAVGMTTGFLVFPLSFAALGVMAELRRPSRRAWALLLLAPLLLFVHKTAAISFAFPALFLVASHGRKLTLRIGLFLGGCAALALAANWFWISPMLQYMSHATFDPAISYWSNQDPLALLRDLTNPSAKIGVLHRQEWWGDLLFRNLVLIGALWAAWKSRHTWPRWIGYAAMTAAIGLFAYGASFVEALRPFDPSRYVPLFFLFLTLPATAWLVRRVGPGRAAALLLALLVVAGVLPSSSRHFLQQPIDSRPAPQLEAMAGWIDSLPGKGRVHVETFSSFYPLKPPWNEQFARVAIKLPTRTRRPLLGGHYSGIFLDFNHANFFSAVWQGKAVDKWNEAEFAQQIRLYNVEYLLTWSAEAARALRRFTDTVEAVSAPEGFAGWRVKQPAGYFLRGAGKLESWFYDELEFIDVAGEDGVAVVSFHYVPDLVCRGADAAPAYATATGVTLTDPGAQRDPVPLLALREVQSHVVCTFKGGVF
ncbi:MAG: hypothetical protein P9L99_06120 [Candidatus Lernaella stagnicola]|nr:hypothetical protein [Candidatus Lernaella stagnicola]